MDEADTNRRNCPLQGKIVEKTRMVELRSLQLVEVIPRPAKNSRTGFGNFLSWGFHAINVINPQATCCVLCIVYHLGIKVCIVILS
jgi:hypothetical protein